MADQLDLMDRYTLLLAAQAGGEVKDMNPTKTGVGGAPMQ
jgi:hypothetical protein